MEREERYIKHELVRPGSIEYREYQVRAASLAINRNTLIVLPTGTGKTVIGLLIIAEWIKRNPDSKIILIAPTRPLVNQHYNFLKKYLMINYNEIVYLSGEIPPFKRNNLWKKRLIVSTPQVVFNDIINFKIKVKDNWLVIFDEAHRSVKEHPYAKIARLINVSSSPRIVGLTASPGDLHKTKEIMSNLKIDDIIALTRSDEDLKKYLQPVRWKLVNVIPPPQVVYAIDLLKKVISSKVTKFNSLFDNTDSHISLMNKMLSYTKLDELRNKIERLYLDNKISNHIRKESLTLINQLIMLDKLLTYLESYSYKSFIEYYQKIRSKALRRSLTAKLLLNDRMLNDAYILIKELDDQGYVHPKIEKLVNILGEVKGKSIVFTSIKNVAFEICEVLNKNGLKSLYLVGQNKKKGSAFGMKQKDQVLTLKQFSIGDYRVLVSTHVGEEGLDISEVSNVFFYDNPISAIRRIQRQGRTGRTSPGNIYFIIMKGTRDESRYWAGLSKERKLLEELKELKPKIISMENKIKPLTDYLTQKQLKTESLDDNFIVYIDYRERSGDITNYLREAGVKIELTDLEVGDYLIGNYIIERKTMDDLAASIVDGRIFKQLSALKSQSGKAIMVIEGNLIDFTKKLDLNVYSGILLSIIEDFDIPLIITNSSKETAEFFKAIIRRLNIKKDKYAKLRLEKKPMELRDIQKFVLAGIPGINKVLAEKLLNTFGTLSSIANASPKQLMKVEGIGPQLARRIYEVFHKEFK